jgi:GT2 family glycosyltransferase
VGGTKPEIRNRRMKVSIAILTYNRASILGELLNSLGEICYPALEIIVVDNHSTDGTERLIQGDFPGVKYFRMPYNRGVAARNVGITKASGDIVITLDDDIMGMNDRNIANIISLFESRKNVGAICFKILDYETNEVCNWCHHYRKEEFSNKEFITDEITEGAVAFRKAVFEKAGLYPEYFFISYEGPDLLLRMLDSGYKTIYSPLISVMHRTAQEGREKWRRYYYDTRNQIWFVVRNYSFAWGIRYLLRGLTAMFFYSIRDGFLRYWVKGVLDASRGIIKVTKDRRPISLITRKTLIEIAAHRPGLGYTLKQRLFKKGICL